MDVTDYRIIEILQKDGRISMKDLGKIVGLTSPAVSVFPSSVDGLK